MNRFRPLLACILLGLAAAGHAHATKPQPPRQERFEQQDWRQDQRIHQGLASGQLTRPEARRLLAQQARIDATERRYRADGWLDRAERQHLAALHWEAGRDLRRALNDRRVAWRR